MALPSSGSSSAHAPTLMYVAAPPPIGFSTGVCVWPITTNAAGSSLIKLARAVRHLLGGVELALLREVVIADDPARGDARAHEEEGRVVEDADDARRDEHDRARERERETIEQDAREDAANRARDRRDLQRRDRAEALDADVLGLREEPHAPVVLFAERARRVGEIRAAQSEQLDHRLREAQTEADHAAQAEARRKHDVAHHAHRLVTALADAVRRPHDEAKEHVAEAARDAPRIERRERRHHVLGGAERIVLVPVLDVRDVVPVEEPRVELDAPEELVLVDLAAVFAVSAAANKRRRNSRCTSSQWNSTSWLPCTSVSAWPRATNKPSASKTSGWRFATRRSFARA